MPSKNTVINIDKQWVEKATEFAEVSIGTNIDIYAKRNQKDIEQGKIDNRNGKIGEMVAYSYLQSIFPDVSYPDFGVYEKKSKSWDKDLLSRETNKKFGVKSQTIELAKIFEESWVFQNEDEGIHGEKDKADDDNFVVFVLLDLREKLGYVRGVTKVKWLHEHGLFKPMKVARLNTKKAVYYADLRKHKTELWQI